MYLNTLQTFVLLVPLLQPILVLHVGFMVLDVLHPPDQNPRTYRLALIALFSASIIYALASSMEFTPGVRIDARFGVIGAAAVFAGPLVATVSVVLGILFRQTLGGMGQLTGQVGMVAALLSFLFLRKLLEIYNKRKFGNPSLSTKQQLLVALSGMMLCLVEIRGLFMLHLGAEKPVPWAPGLTGAILVCEGLIVMLLFSVLQLQQRFSAAHRKVAASEAELRGILAAMPDTLLTFDDQRRILEIRKRTPSHMYPDLPALIGRPLTEVVPPNVVDDFMKMVDDAMAQDIVKEQQFSATAPDGKICHADVRIVRLDEKRGLAVLRDLTEKVQQEEQLNVAREKLELLAQNMQDMMGLIEPDGTISYATPSCSRLEGFIAQSQHVDAWKAAVSTCDLNRALTAIEEVRNGTRADAQHEVRARRPGSDEWVWLQMRYTPVIRDGARTGQVLAQARNISAVRDLQRRARLAELAVHHITDGVLVARVSDDTIVWCNRGFTALSGYTEQQTTDKQVDVLLNSFPVQGAERKAETLAATGSWSGELLSQRRDGSWFPEWRHVSLFDNPVDGAQYYVKILRDLSQERSQQETVYSLKHRDSLTGLPNRGYFLSAVNVHLSQQSRDTAPFAVAMVTLQDFDTIAKAHGRSISDRVLKLVAVRLRSSVGDTVPLARVDSHTFAVLLEREVSTPLLARNMRAVLGQFKQPFLVDGKEIRVEASIGIARFPDDGDSADALIHKSHLAVESNAARGGGQVVFFQREAEDTGLRRLSLEAALRATLMSDAPELYVEYQPRIGLDNQEVEGFEALLRWQHPEFGKVAPNEFIPMAEESGLIHFLGSWVFETVCAQLAAWRDAGLILKPVAVNLSVRQMHDDKLPQRLVEAARKYGIDLDLLELEVTEAEVMNDLAFTSGMLRQLRDMGFRIALDDFGTGYSSMAYLQRLPLDVLKLDRSFVRELGQNKEGDEVVRALVAMAHSLELKTVAEGVETEEQRQFLLDIGCHAMQGFLFSPAVSEDDTRSWLAHRPAMLQGVRPLSLSTLHS